MRQHGSEIWSSLLGLQMKPADFIDINTSYQPSSTYITYGRSKIKITFQERLDLAADGVRHPVVRDALHVLQLVVVRHHGVAPVGDQVHNLVPPCTKAALQHSIRADYFKKK